jgi:hypothetical protein
MDMGSVWLLQGRRGLPKLYVERSVLLDVDGKKVVEFQIGVAG